MLGRPNLPVYNESGVKDLSDQGPISLTFLSDDDEDRSRLSEPVKRISGFHPTSLDLSRPRAFVARQHVDNRRADCLQEYNKFTTTESDYESSESEAGWPDPVSVVSWEDTRHGVYQSAIQQQRSTQYYVDPTLEAIAANLNAAREQSASLPNSIAGEDGLRPGGSRLGRPGLKPYPRYTNRPRQLPTRQLPALRSDRVDDELPKRHTIVQTWNTSRGRIIEHEDLLDDNRDVLPYEVMKLTSPDGPARQKHPNNRTTGTVDLMGAEVQLLDFSCDVTHLLDAQDRPTRRTTEREPLITF